MGLTVYGGGGKPEEEKTVIAGTSVMEVNPSSGKVMKKVTVNPTPTESKEVTAGTSDTTVSPTEGKHLSGVTVHPTPSQEKTVMPTADGFKVSPETGKLLSAVFVDGDSDLVAGNIKQGVNIFGVDGSFDNSHGAYVWKKLTAEGGDFVDFVVSDQSTAYPDGGEQDGYWYEKVVEGKTGIDFGEVRFTSITSSNLVVSHSLNKVPSYAFIIPKTGIGKSDNYVNIVQSFNPLYNGDRGLIASYSSASTLSLQPSVSIDNITFKCVESVYWAPTTYIWVAIA